MQCALGFLHSHSRIALTGTSKLEGRKIYAFAPSVRFLLHPSTVSPGRRLGSSFKLFLLEVA